MKKVKIFLLVVGGLVLIYFGAKTYRSISVVDKPTELKTGHFIISYQGIYPEEAQEVGETLEKNYDRIRSRLIDPDHEMIWVFIHPTKADFNIGTGLLSSTANGTSRGPDEFHILWTNWFNSILPNDPIKTALHEFTHCVQLNILIKEEQEKWGNASKGDFDKMFEEKFIKEYPQWFWEAICDYEAGMVNSISVQYGMRKNLTLKDLNSSNQIYNVGYTIIEYIVEKWGEDKLPALITSYVDIETVLGVSESDFEKGWVEFVTEKY
ncbi:MAG: hypothetical protein IPO83_13840 [Chitinophagaceae bacterium]|nr:hypothetical protein [Chitinophagaceae bacterium]